jgi:hypothetical protein
MLLKEIIAVYSENLGKHMNAHCLQNAKILNAKVCDAYNNLSVLIGIRKSWSV